MPDSSYELRRQPNGAYAVYHAGLQETMHPNLGPWEEATRLYVAGTDLERALTAPVPAGKSGGAPTGEIVVFDVGLGGAANALAAISCKQGLARAGRPTRTLTVVSFEQELAALEFVVDHADQLGYARGYEEAIHAILDNARWEAPGIRWELRKGDFADLIQAEPRRADIVFYDPFSRRSNPGMWSVPVLESVYRCKRPGGGQRLITYSSAFCVRAAFLLAGYYVGEGIRPYDRPTTIATTSVSDLEDPLDLGWLGRWRRDREPWPPGTAHEHHKAVREALLAHPQWSRFEAEAEERPRSKKPFGRPQGSGHKAGYASKPGHSQGGRPKHPGKPKR